MNNDIFKMQEWTTLNLIKSTMKIQEQKSEKKVHKFTFSSLPFLTNIKYLLH